MIQPNLRTIREVARSLNIDHTTARRYVDLAEIEPLRVAGGKVCLLTDEQAKIVESYRDGKTGKK
jgi:predicted site-specific integrase-resolvase